MGIDYWEDKDVEDAANATAMLTAARKELIAQIRMSDTVRTHAAELIALDPGGLAKLLKAFCCWQRKTGKTTVLAHQLRGAAEARVDRREQWDAEFLEALRSALNAARAERNEAKKDISTR